MKLGLGIGLTNPVILNGGGFDPAAFLSTYPAARWWSPRQLDQSDSTAITAVSDLSENGDDLAQGTEINQPTFIIDAGVGRARFHTGAWLSLVTDTDPLDIGSVTKLTAIAAIKHQDSGATRTIFEEGSPTIGGFGMYLNNGSSGMPGGGAGINSSNYTFRNVSGAGTVPRSYVFSMTIDTTADPADQMTFRVDGIAQASVTPAENGTLSGNILHTVPFRVGRRHGGSLYLVGDIYDLLIIPGGVVADDQLTLETHLFNSCGF